MTHPSDFSLAALRVSECRLMLYLRGAQFDGARVFYQGLLRFPVRHEWNGESGRGVMFDCGSCVIELIDPGPVREIPAPVGVSLRVPDAAALRENLIPRVSGVTELRDREWGETDFEVRDPNGFRVVFFTPTAQLGGKHHDEH